MGSLPCRFSTVVASFSLIIGGAATCYRHTSNELNVARPPRTALSGHETVYLDGLDGFGFERLCERIYRKLDGITGVERIGGAGDGGRDLVVDGPGGKMIVECKHQPGSSVGRPVVQKLHSAVITNGAVSGAILTTGRFTKAATEYAASLVDAPIKLYDRYRLADLADGAGIRLVSGEEEAAILSYPTSGAAELGRQISDYLGLQSSPAPAHDLIKLEPQEAVLEPCYAVSADIAQDFTTSVGLIHRLDERGVMYVFDARTGAALVPAIAGFLAGSAPVEPGAAPLPQCRSSSPGFAMGTTALKGMVERQMIQDYTRSVSYRGRNNRTYTKTCRPGPRSIRINDVKQVRLPRLAGALAVLGKRHPCSLIQNGRGVMLDCPGMRRCSACGGDAGDGALLCNSCGAVAHAPKRFGTHSHVCSVCGMTLCKACAFHARRALFLKRTTCRKCAGPKARQAG